MMPWSLVRVGNIFRHWFGKDVCNTYIVITEEDQNDFRAANVWEQVFRVMLDGMANKIEFWKVSASAASFIRVVGESKWHGICVSKDDGDWEQLLYD